MSNSTFEDSVAVLAKISLTCPNMADFYTKAKYVFISTISASSLTELGSIITGITQTDFSQITSEYISSITPTAWKYMPVSIVNSLTTSQLSGLTNTQISSLLNSPNYSSYSSLIQSSITSLSNNLPVNTKNNSNKINGSILLFISIIAFKIIFFI